jgi:cytochrome b561
MGTFSPTHWFIVLVMITPLMALLVVPTWRILQRAGFNGAWALLMLVPVVGLLVSDAAELRWWWQVLPQAPLNPGEPPPARRAFAHIHPCVWLLWRPYPQPPGWPWGPWLLQP